MLHKHNSPVAEIQASRARALPASKEAARQRALRVVQLLQTVQEEAANAAAPEEDKCLWFFCLIEMLKAGKIKILLAFFVDIP